VGDKEEDGAVVVALSRRGMAKPGEEEEGEDEEDKDGEASKSRAAARRREDEPVSAVSNTSWRGTSASGPSDEDLALGRSSKPCPSPRRIIMRVRSFSLLSKSRSSSCSISSSLSCRSCWSRRRAGELCGEVSRAATASSIWENRAGKSSWALLGVGRGGGVEGLVAGDNDGSIIRAGSSEEKNTMRDCLSVSVCVVSWSVVWGSVVCSKE